LSASKAPAKPAASPKPRRGGCLRRLAALCLLALLAAGAAAYWGWNELHRPGPLAHGAPAAPQADVAFVVRPGESALQILRHLEDARYIRSALLGRIYLRWGMGSPALQAGEYDLPPALSTVEVLEKLRRGEVRTLPLTLIEGLTVDETAQAIAAAGLGDIARLRAEFASPGRIADLDPSAIDLEGYLFPETYRFARATGEREIADTLAATFRRRYEARVRPLRSAGDTRPLREVVILASLVEKEARLDSERSLIAAVYANRLRRGIGLFADPTIIHGLKLLGRWDGNLRKSDLRMDSPWNTYRVAGLPPGPICSPGLASLEAAAQPADVEFLYFVSRNDGSHVFSTTLDEHNRNVERWQKRPWRERAAARRAAE
jgi:UPF0755 protein